MRVRREWQGLACVAAVLLLSLTAAAAAGAETFTWTDGIGSGGSEPGSGLWSEAHNWASETAPSGGPVNLDFPVQRCATPFYGCPPAEDDVPGLEVGTLAIGNRVVRFLSEPLAPGELPHLPPAHEPPPATYTLKGAQTLKLREGIDVETTSEGEGEGLEASGGTEITMPLVLTGANTWHVGREAGGTSELPGAALDLTGPLSGDEPLTVILGGGDALQLDAPTEVGPTAVEGGGAMTIGTPTGGGDLNGLDGNAVRLHDVSLAGAGTTGPLNLNGGSLDVGFPGSGGTLSVNGALALEGSTDVYMEEPSAITGLPARLTAASAALGGVKLLLGERCPAAGTVFTLVEAPGGVTGSFSDSSGNPIVDGETIEPAPNGCGPHMPGAPLRIAYDARAVTATALGPAATGQKEGGGQGAQQNSGPGPGSGHAGIESYAALASAMLRGDLRAAADARTVKRLLRRGAATVWVVRPAGARLTLTWSVASTRHARRGVLLASDTIGPAGAQGRRLSVRPRRRAEAVWRRTAHVEVTVRVALAEPGQAPLTLVRHLLLG